MSRSLNLISLVLLCMLVIFRQASAQRYWIATTASNWNNTANWSASSGGTGGASVPGSGDRAVFDGAGGRNGNCLLDIAPSVSYITINGYSGIIDLSGNNLSVGNGGSSSFATGTVNNSGALASLSITSTSWAPVFSGTVFGERINITTNTKALQLNGSTFGVLGSAFNGQCTFQATDGNPVNTSTGNNTFNMPVSFSLTSSSSNFRWDLTSTNPDVFNSDVSVSLTGSSTRSPTFRFATGANCTFNGNITLASNYTNNVTNVGGIYFGNGDNVTGAVSTGGYSTLASSGQLTITPTFNGRLRMERFTHNGTSATTFGLSNAANTEITFGACTFQGDVIVNAGHMCITSSSFNGTNNQFVVTNLSAFQSYIGGGNSFGPTGGTPGITVFESTVGNSSRFFNVGVNALTSPDSRIVGTGADTYYSSVIFRHSGGGSFCGLRPAYSSSSGYYGDITWDNNSSATMGFGAGGGASLIFSGPQDQAINKIAGTANLATPTVAMSKSGAGKLILQTPVIFSNIDFTSGIIETTSTNILSIAGTCSNASNASHVDGPVQRTGSSAFTFPTGDAGHYGPIGISTISASDTYTAENFFVSAYTVGPGVSSPLVKVSGCEYWTLTRTGTSTANVTLSWTSADCPLLYVLDPPDLRIAQFSGGAWNAVGSTASGGSTNASGTISTTSALGSFTAFSLGSITADNPLPIELTGFSAEQRDDHIELSWETASEWNSDRFEIERSSDGSAFQWIASRQASGNSQVTKKYSFQDFTPAPENNYYRLRQFDVDGSVTVSKIIRVFFETEKLTVYPNPVGQGGTVSLSGAGSSIIILCDHLGRKSIHPVRSNKLDLSGLTEGVYTVMTEKGDTVRLLVK